MRGRGADQRVILKPPVGHAAAKQSRWPALAGIAAATVIAGLAAIWLPRTTETGAPPPPLEAPAAVAPAARPEARLAALAPPTLAPPTLAPSPAPSPAPPAAIPPAPEPLAAPPDDPPIRTADEQHILDHDTAAAGGGVTVFRFAGNPRILVMDFASLRDQGTMLNRVASFAEKAGLPRDRVLSDPELDRAIQAGGDTPETFYYGHDYGAPTLARFFALAGRDNIALRAPEETLRALLHREGWFEPNALAGLISIPAAGTDPKIDRPARAAILRHELSHGEYFTNPAYTAFVHRFWTQSLTAAEREAVRRFLLSHGYDPALDDLMENEAQAYLVFTDHPDFFAPSMIGMNPVRLNALRQAFYRTMPGGWLRDSLGRVLNDEKNPRNGAR